MSTGLRVCFFNRSYWPDTGATGQLLTELAEDLAAQHGFEVTVITGVSSNGSPRHEVRNGVTIVRAAGTRFTPSVFAGRVSNYLSYFTSALLHAVKLPKQDVVVALTDPPVIGLAALAAARGRTPFVFFCQDIFPEVGALVENVRSRVVDGVLERVNRILVSRADRIVALGETMSTRLRAGKGATDGQIAVIHNWADTTAIVPSAKQNRFAAAHDLVSRFVVLHAGNIGLAQSLETVLDAASLVKDMPDVLFLFIGEGSQRAALEARACERRLDNVRFLPFQPRDQMRWTYASADVCLVSLKAGLSGYIVPSKLYPILAAGRAYIAAVDRTSEVAAITERFQCGVVTPPGDAAALAAAVGRLRGDCDTRARMASAGRAAAPLFDRARQVSAHAALLRDVVASSEAAGSGGSDVKRLFDVALASAGLIVSAPLWAVIALAVKIEDGGPVFFVQDRVGRHGRTFRALKFRSMVRDAEHRSGAIQAAENDPRVTKIGRILRATAFDELPQLINILVGDMSFVGPRPLRPGEVDTTSEHFVPLDAIPGYGERHQVRPGLTGLAQVHAPRDVPRDEKFRYDIEYVRSRTPWIDLKLILLSFWISLRGRWEYREPKL